VAQTKTRRVISHTFFLSVLVLIRGGQSAFDHRRDRGSQACKWNRKFVQQLSRPQLATFRHRRVRRCFPQPDARSCW
jgi:hypothetical protein